MAPITVKPATCAIVPDDYSGIVPKVDVKEGDSVEVGSKLFHDKQFTDIVVTSPVAGTVTGVIRGERRKLERIVITPAEDAGNQSLLKPKASTTAHGLNSSCLTPDYGHYCVNVLTT